MPEHDVEKSKLKADTLIASYGRFSIISHYDEALDYLADIWELTPLELQLLKPKTASGASSLLKKASGALAGTAKSSVKAAPFMQAANVAKSAASMSEAATIAKDKIAGAGTLAKKAGVIALAFAKRNPLALATVTAGTAATSVYVGQTLLNSLRQFNEECYLLRKSSD